MSWMFSDARTSAARAFMAPQSTTPMPATRRIGAWPMNMFSATRELGVEAELLVHRGDAGRLRLVWAVEGHVLAIHAERAAVRPMHPGDDLDERGLAGAVLADQRVDLAGIGGEVDVLQRLHAGERLRDALELEQRCHAAVAHSSRCVRSRPPWGPGARRLPCLRTLPNVGPARCIRLRLRRWQHPRGPAASWRDGWPPRPRAR